MSKSHGTTSPTQLGTVIAAVITAVCTAVGDFSIAELINALCNQGEKLTRVMRVVFTAFITGQEVVLAEATTQVQKLLESMGAIAAATVEKFVAKDYFKIDDSNSVKIAYFGDNFKKYFLKKTETDIAAATLRSYKLTEASLDPPIITALGSNHETTLTHLWELFKLQPNGEPGILLTNGYANIFYIRDAEGTLWAVSARWHSDGWSVGADSVDDPDGWHAGRQVFGR